MLGAGNPYVYPDNLPRVNANGGPEGRPGCWQPVTRDLWPSPYLVMDTGASIAPYNHIELGQPHRHRVHLGPSDRGEHDQPMKITGTAIKLGAFALVLLLFTAIIIVVFGQMRFDRTTGYSAIFSNASGLRAGQFVRASGVEVGKVSKVELLDGGRRAKVDFDVERDLPLFQGTTASIRYLNLIGDRYLELKRGDDDQRLPAGGTIPMERTEPALDLDALIGGFRPLFRALDPDKVNNIAQSIITIFQGQGGTINDILDQTRQLTSALADRDQAIGEVIRNLNTVLDTTVKHQKQFDETVVDFEKLITGLKNRADPIADVGRRHQRRRGHHRRPARRQPSAAAEHRRPTWRSSSSRSSTRRISSTTSWSRLPTALKIIGRAGGVYGDFFNFYACDVTLKLPGLQPGGPVRTVKVWSQPTGRCTPQ